MPTRHFMGSRKSARRQQEIDDNHRKTMFERLSPKQQKRFASKSQVDIAKQYERIEQLASHLQGRTDPNLLNFTKQRPLKGNDWQNARLIKRQLDRAQSIRERYFDTVAEIENGTLRMGKATVNG